MIDLSIDNLHWNSVGYVYLGIITLLAFSLRLFRLGKWSFWTDEIFSVQHALDGFTEGVKGVRSPHPIYYMGLMFVLGKLGVNEFSARIIATMIGATSVPLLTFAFQPFVGVTTALLFGGLLAVAPWHIYWSQNARFYTMTLLLQTLAILALFYGLETNQWSYIILFFLLYAISTLAHETSFITLLVVGTYMLSAYLLPLEPPVGLTIWRFVLVLLLPSVFTIVVYFTIGGGFTKRAKKVRYDWKFHYSNPVSSPSRVLVGTLRYMGLPIAVVTMMSIILSFDNLDRFTLLMITQIIVPIILVTVGAKFVYTTTRYALLVLPAFLYFTSRAVTMAGIIEYWLGFMLFLTLLSTAFDDLFLYYFYSNGNRERWRESLSSIVGQIRKDDIIFSTTPNVVQYYLKLPVRWLDNEICTTLEEIQTKAWFILDKNFNSRTYQIRDWITSHTQVVYTDNVQFHAQTFNVTIRQYNPKKTENPNVVENDSQDKMQSNIPNKAND